MFKDYYAILGIDGTASSSDIKSAYHKQALKWHPDKNPGKDTEAEMKDVNEAYSILNNPQSKERYDKEYSLFNSLKYSSESSNTSRNSENSTSSANTSNDNQSYYYSYDVSDDDLKNDINNARRSAEEFVKEFFSNLSSDASKAANGAWNAIKPFAILALISLVISLIVGIASSASKSEDSVSESFVSEPIELPGWIQYEINTDFYISVPPSLELQVENSKYGNELSSRRLMQDGIIFQQKGLSDMETDALNKYCRIMIYVAHGSIGDYMNRNETTTLDSDWKYSIQELVRNQIGSVQSLMGDINYQWETFNNAKALVVNYKRTGNNFNDKDPVIAKLAILQDNDKLVQIVLAYKANESQFWAEDFSKVLSTFKWE